MPIYDFSCRACSHTFEALVRKNTPACPECASEDLEKLVSLPVVRSAGSHAKTMAQAKQRELRTAAEKNHAQQQYEASHDD